MTTSPAAPRRTLREIAEVLGVEAPDTDLAIDGVAGIEEAGPTHLTFLQNDKYVAKLRASRAGAALIPADLEVEEELGLPVLRVERPRLAFVKLLDHFHPPRTHVPGVHPTAIVPDSCELGEDVSIGAYVVLGERVRLGARTRLHPHAVVYDDAVLGADCEIHSHASVREQCVLGDRVVVHNGSVIGADGFGFEPDAEGRLHKMPQVGHAELGDDVEIQALAAVDRAAMGATVVGEGTKIDNFAQVAHGCTVGKHTVLCGQVGLAGSTKVGSHVMLGGQVGVAGHIEIGDGVQAAATSGIIADVPPGMRVGGTPAVPIKEAFRNVLMIQQLPKLMKRVKAIEARLEEDE